MFNLEFPWILLALPLPWIIYKTLPRAQQAGHAILRVPYYQQLKSLVQQHQRLISSTSQHAAKLLFTAWCCLLIAASGPVWLGQSIDVKRQARNIFLAIDISNSMQIPDMELLRQPVDRLQMVKQVASQFIKQRSKDRIGLILFGSKTYLQTPLTFDHDTVTYMMNDASIGLAGPLTALGDAIALGVKRLQETKEQDRVIILLTDGANNTGILDPIQAAKIAKENNIKIFTIGLGAARLNVPGILGNQIINPSRDLDLPTLKKIAKITDGLFFRAKSTEDLKNVYQTIDKLVPSSNYSGRYQPQIPLFRYPLLLALLISCYLLAPFLSWSQILPWRRTLKKSQENLGVNL